MAPSVYPTLAIGLTTAAFMATRTVRDGLLFQQSGPDQLPLLYALTHAGLALAAILHVAAMRRFGTRKTRIGVFTLFALVLLAATPFLDAEHPRLVASLFPLLPIMFAALFASAWLLAGDLLESTPPELQRKAYARLGTSGLLSGMIGALATKGLAAVSSPRAVGLMSALLLFAALIVSARAHAAYPNDERQGVAKPPPRINALELLRTDKTARTMAILASLGTVSAMLIEFQVYATVAASGKASTQIFGNLYLLTSGLALALQVFVAPRFLDRFGVLGGLLCLPLIVVLGGGAVSWAAVPAIAISFRATETAVRNSIHQTCWEQLYLGFSGERRNVLKTTVDGVVARIAGLATAGLVWLVLVLAPADAGRILILIAIIAVGATWIVRTRALRHLGCTEVVEEFAIPVPDI